MAAPDNPQGYQCEFVDSVPDDFYCKNCSLVARRLTFTSCCGESYCQACIADIQQQDKPCPACGQQSFTTTKLLKYQQRMECFKVYCSMRMRGCDWLGTLEHLEMHLDPERNSCRYVDTKCPLSCQQTIPKNTVGQHVAMECVKRDYTCQHCAFKGTYEAVVDTHSPECTHFPLKCPNLCGEICKRGDMEDHMRICELEEVACEFSGVGCDGRFRRKYQEEHDRRNNWHHLTATAATASAALKANQRLQQKLQEQDTSRRATEQTLEQMCRQLEGKLQQQEENFLNILEEQEQRNQKKLRELEQKFLTQFEEQEQRLEEHNEEQKRKVQQQEQRFLNKSEEQEKRFKEQEQRSEEKTCKVQEHEREVEKKFREQQQAFHKLFQDCDKKLMEFQEKSNQNEEAVKELAHFVSLKRTFAMENFSKEQAKDTAEDWKSPAMFTHMYGYKFCIGIDANGHDCLHGKAMRVDLWGMQGEYDKQLKWPAQASFTIELLNQNGGESIKHTVNKVKWERPGTLYRYRCGFARIMCGHVSSLGFLEHCKLTDFLANDTLYFHLTNISVD